MGTMNACVFNSPLRFVDPSGLFWVNIGGAVLGGIGAYITGGSSTDVAIGAAAGFVFPTAGPVAGAALGYIGHMMNPDLAGNQSDIPSRPLPPEIQNVINQQPPLSSIPPLDPLAGQPQIQPVCGH